MKKKSVMFAVLTVLLVSVLSLSIAVFAKSEVEPYSWENINGEYFLINNQSQVLEQRIDGTFTVLNTRTNAWTEVVNRNNIFSARVHMYPSSFALDMTGVDIMVSWSGSARTWDNVQLNEQNTANIPWDGGRYRIFVRPRGAGGTMTMRIWDEWWN